MPGDIKAIDQLVEVTEDNPYENSSPTYVEVPILRIDGESDKPSVEAQEATSYDGRTQRSAGVSDFTHMVRKAVDLPDTVVQLFIDADNNRTPLWLRITPLQDDAPAQVYGGDLGYTVLTGDMEQEFGGHKIKTVRYTAIEANAGTLIGPDPNAATSS